MNIEDTICAISTPPGIGGIAVARISGADAFAIADRMWIGKRKIAELPANTCAVGTVTDTKKGVLDQAVATVFHAPHSFTGDNVVEISIHGSKWIQQELLLSLIKEGARLAEPGEFTRRAFSNGRLDLTQAEAIADMIASTSRASQRLAMNQMRGEFSKRIEAMRAKLLDLAALLELELDFSEEDVEFASRKQLEELARQIQDSTAQLSRGFATGQAIREGIPVAIVGATNAGKSSLMNALAHDERAIVSDIHGTTRDVIEEILTIGDYTIRLKDTAGIRTTEDKIESLGMERSRQAMNSASIILLVVDNMAPIDNVPWDDVKATMASNPSATLVIAANKCDISQAHEAYPLQARYIIPTSATTGIGVEELRGTLNTILDEIASGGDAGDVMTSNVRHFNALQEASEAAARVVSGIQAGIPGDLISQDLRQCISALSSITGTISTPEILSTIFSRFCIGK